MLASFESQTFGELKRGSAVGLIKRVDNLKPVPELRRDLERLQLDDLYLWELRFSSAERVFFAQSGPNLFLLWWDPDHTRYPTKRYRKPTGN